MQTDTEKYLADFTHREDALMILVRARNIKLPERLANWRLWIGDSQIYLNELRNYLETH